MAKHLHLVWTYAIQGPYFAAVWVAQRICGLAEIALTHGIDGLGCHLPVDGIVFVNDLDHFALNWPSSDRDRPDP